MPLHLFVYGTLKKGFGNHDNYCSNAISIESARLDGELYDSVVESWIIKNTVMERCWNTCKKEKQDVFIDEELNA